MKKDTMNLPKESLVEEVFIIKNDEIDFLGTIINAQENSSQICGRILLPNGNPLVFYSTKGKQEILREVLRGQCETLAACYQAQTYHLPLKSPMSWEEFEAIFLTDSQAGRWTNFIVN